MSNGLRKFSESFHLVRSWLIFTENAILFPLKKFKISLNNLRETVNNMFSKKRQVNKMLDRIALLLLIVGGVNWGLLGIFRFDLVAFLFGGQAAIISRIVYVLVGISAIWCISLFFKDQELLEARS